MRLKNIDLFHVISVACFFAMIAFYLLGATHFVMVIAAAAFLGGAILSAIHHAETVAEYVGSSLGTLILALAVTVIEVGLIVSMMASAETGGETIARDTVFSAVIIVTNGIAGFCFVLGGIRYKELPFSIEGTSAILSVLACLVGLTLVLPNFTSTTVGPTYSNAQLIFASAASLILYGALLVSQTITHKEYFVDENPASKSDKRFSKKGTLIGLGFLVLSLFAVIGLAKVLSPSIEAALTSLGAPQATVGIVIALLVLMPEAGAALSAARSNNLQTSLNLSLGSGAASVALTIPAVSLYSILTGKPLALGLDSKALAILLLTFIVSSFTLSSGKVSALKGFVHLSILIAYIALAFMP